MIDSVMNYTGSKFKLLDQILPEFDYTKNTFVDVFSGGGSVYINIVDKYDRIIVNDIISELIGIHRGIIESDDIINSTKLICPEKGDAESFSLLRQDFNNSPSPDKLWALMLSSTNNMMRFNKKFKYNQTYGDRGWNSNTDKKVEVLKNYIRLFKDKIEFKSVNFYDLEIENLSMVYLDPPYLETEAGYNAYFSKEDGEKLFNYCKKLDVDGHSFMLSGVVGEHKNGKRSKLIDDLISDGYNYKILEYNYEKVARIKNNKNSKEVIITNY